MTSFRCSEKAVMKMYVLICICSGFLEKWKLLGFPITTQRLCENEKSCNYIVITAKVDEKGSWNLAYTLDCMFGICLSEGVHGWQWLNFVMSFSLQVFMIDYGFKEVLSTSNVRAILRQFRRHASFCFPCKLYGLQPTGGMEEWSKSSIESMQDLVTNRRLFLIKRVCYCLT